MRTTIATIAVLLLALNAVTPAAESETAEIVTTSAEVKPVEQDKPLVQMAILLDTSGSMSGLIDQARTELWAIVNEFIFAKRNGMQPELKVGLYEYGKSSIPAQEGYIRMICPLTTDLDKISEELFALKTNGGSEHCGQVIKQAVEGLQWSPATNDLKVIFIAGNEPFTQGPIPYQQACKLAVEKGIIVNTIHCGNENTGVDGKWKDGAMLADGKFLNIDHNRKVVHIEAPQDKEIAELNARLNTTYIGYGRLGTANSQRQAAQDTNAHKVSAEAVIQRAVTKASFNYRNDSWDLVDAVKNDTVELAEIESEDLPEEMQKMTEEQKKQYVEAKARKRAELQQKIQTLNEARKKYVAEQMKKQSGKPDTLGSAVLKAVRLQAEKKNFEFEQPKEPK